MSEYGEPWFKACGTGGEAQVLKHSLELVTTLAPTNGKHEEATRIVQCVNACDGLEDPEKEIADLREQNASLLRLIADIRAAAGDPNGRLMLDELVEHIRTMRRGADAYSIESVRMKGDLI